MKIEIEFNDVESALPEKSGEYMVVVDAPRYVATLLYSAKHKAFNATDFGDNDAEIEVKYWAAIPQELKDES